MHLHSVEGYPAGGGWGRAIGELRAAGLAVPQILHLFGYKPDRTDLLARFAQEVMRGSSPLSPGQRELIAAFTSGRSRCRF